MKYLVVIVSTLLSINSFAVEPLHTLLFLKHMIGSSLSLECRDYAVGDFKIKMIDIRMDDSPQEVSNSQDLERALVIVDGNQSPYSEPQSPSQKILKHVIKHANSQKNFDPKKQKRNHYQPSTLHKQPYR